MPPSDCPVDFEHGSHPDIHFSGPWIVDEARAIVEAVAGSRARGVRSSTAPRDGDLQSWARTSDDALRFGKDWVAVKAVVSASTYYFVGCMYDRCVYRGRSASEVVELIRRDASPAAAAPGQPPV